MGAGHALHGVFAGFHGGIVVPSHRFHDTAGGIPYGRSAVSVTTIRRRTAAFERRPLAAARACRQSAPPGHTLDPQPQAAAGPPVSVAGRDRNSSLFPGWRWAVVGLGFPISGLIGGAISGPVDAAGPALIGGALTGAGLGAAVWLAARDVFGTAAALIAASAAGYGLGLLAGAALVGYETDLGSLAAMGAISGAVLERPRDSRWRPRDGDRWQSRGASRCRSCSPPAGAHRRLAASTSTSSSPSSEPTARSFSPS